LTAPYYQYIDLPETFNSNDKICWAKRLTDNEFKKEYSYKDIEQKSFSIRYKNFIMSPRSFYRIKILLQIFILFDLLVYSYIIFFEFKNFYSCNDFKKFEQNTTKNIDNINKIKQSSQCSDKTFQDLSWLEYYMCIIMFSYALFHFDTVNIYSYFPFN